MAAVELQTLERIYEYDNYRFFLRDYFKEQKRCRACFSYRYFAQRAGFASSSFCAHVIDGKRNLTVESLRKMMRGLKLTGKAASYFEAMVLFNQARTVEDREHWFKVLERLRKSTQFYKINQKQYAYYDEWYYPVIRELAIYADWHGDFGKLGKLVLPSITADMARKAIETLVSIGLLIAHPDGTWRQSSEAVSAEDVPTVVTRKTRKEFMLMAIAATESMCIDKRHIASTTVSMNEATFREITAMLDEVRKKILEAGVDCSKVNHVYQFNFQAFPVSARIEGPGPKDSGPKDSGLKDLGLNDPGTNDSGPIDSGSKRPAGSNNMEKSV
jgi:uncharacterized protein (TIGR02147 family)